MMDKAEPLIFRFADDGAVPNNRLPFLVYRGAIDVARVKDPAAAIEKTFEKNGWGHGMWRNGIFPPDGHYDLCRGTQAEHARALGTIPRVPLPETDPLYGADGPLTKLWR